MLAAWLRWRAEHLSQHEQLAPGVWSPGPLAEGSKFGCSTCFAERARRVIAADARHLAMRRREN